MKRVDQSRLARMLCHAVVLAMTATILLHGGEKDAAAESRARIVTSGGSVIQCMLDHTAPWTFTANGGAQVLKFEQIDSIELAERVDPNIENDALVAVGDLQNDAFETREKAAAKLRTLGRAAAKPLKQALTSPDAEVVKRARALLAEIGALEDEGISQDRVRLRDGTILRGTLALPEVAVRAHFGRLRFPIEALDRIVVAGVPEKTETAFAALDSKEIAIPLPVAGPVESAAAQLWNPNDDMQNDPTAVDGWLNEAQRNAITMDKITDRAATDVAGAKKLIETKVGDRLEEAYADRGVALRATEANAKVEVSNETIRSFSGGRCLQAKNSDLEIRFSFPGAKHVATAGVLHVGAIVRTGGPGTVGIAGYDASGRLLIQATNLHADAVPNAPVQVDEFLGIRSSTPIARIRIFRMGALKEKGGDLLIDDLVFDRIATAGLRADQSRIGMLSGDELIGKLIDTPTQLAFKAEFLGEQAEPLALKLSDIFSYEPARGIAVDPADEKTGKDGKPKLRRFGLAHGILLQSGETFRGHLFGLDDKIAVVGLSRGVVLKLPRAILRKVDLHPSPTTPGEAPVPTALEKDELPGVEFKTKALFNNPSAPQPKEEKKDPANNPAQGLPRMNNAEILNIDPQTQELTVKDDDGEMTMNLAGIKTLVFPAAPNAANAAASNKRRAWTLILREGSRFDADILRISVSDISAEMAEGTVLLPSETVERIERK